MNSNVKTIRNITLAGHNGSGKTTLAEALLFKSGNTDRFGKISDGTTVCDCDPEEIRRQFSISTALASFNTKDCLVNLLDTPGMPDFAGEMYEGIYAGGTVMITVSAKSGVKTGTVKAFEYAEKLSKSKMFVVTKLDDPNANFYNTLTQLKTIFGPTVCPVIVPVIKDGSIDSYINLIEMKCYKYDDKGNAVETEMPAGDLSDKMDYRLDGLKAAVSEAVAETDEALMEKFFEGEEFTQDELIDAIHNGMNKGLITPVVCVSSANLAGIDMLIKEINLLCPSPAERPIPQAIDKNGNPVEIVYDTDAPLSAFVFKTVADAFVGKMSLIKVRSGKLTAGSDVINARTGETEKIGKLYKLCGKKQTEISEALAGDIVAAVKIDARTSDTLCDGSRVASFPEIEFPVPCYSMAVKAKSQNDEGKLSSALHRITEEDLTLKYTKNELTKERILTGLGEQHIEIAVAEMKTKFGADVVLSVPKIAYKETIRKKVRAEGKHKKQSGGHGQYGHVVIEFEPCLSDELVFEEKVFGGAVPKNYFPAVQKGLEECMAKGVLAGCQMVGVKAILTDGSYHPVDSSEMAFKMAASIAYKDGLKQADPVILEPIGTLIVTAPDDNTGDIMGELNKRRGRTLGMNPVKKGFTEITAEVPMREMHDFTMFLRQISKGMGYFTFDFVRYEQLPANLLSEVLLSIGQE